MNVQELTRRGRRGDRDFSGAAGSMHRIVGLIGLIGLASAGCSAGKMARPMSAADHAPPADHTAGYETREEIAVVSARSDGAMAPARPSPIAPNAGPAAGQTPGQATGQATGTRAQGGPDLQPKLVVEGWLDLDVEDVAGAAAAIRAWVESAGGRVVNESISGGVDAWSGRMVIKMPPPQVDPIMGKMDDRFEITSKRIQGTDVSRTLYDQQIALDNLTLTLDRLRKLLEREGLEMKEILAIETEMTRLRGEIERIKGEKRFLEHRVALATLNIGLNRRDGAVLRPKAKFYPGPKLSTLILLDPGERERVRLGGGAVIHTVPRVTLELDVFAAPDGEDRAILATLGGSGYSDFLGRGKRRFLNPYLGFRLGYAYLDGSRFAFSGGGGVELFKHEFLLIDANVNVVGLVSDEFDAAVVGSASVVVPF